MSSVRPLVLAGLLASAASGMLAGCGGGSENPLTSGKKTPAPVSDETTTAQLTTAAVGKALPSVVAVSVTRAGITTTGTGTVLAKDLVVTDGKLVAPGRVTTFHAPSTSRGAQPTPKATSKPSASPSASPTNNPAAYTGGTAKATTPEATTPQGTTPTARDREASTSAVKIPSPPSVSIREASGDEQQGTVEGIDPVSGLAVIRVNDLDTVPSAKPGGTPRLGDQIASLGFISARRPAVRPGTIVTTGRSVRKNRNSEVGLVEASTPLGAQGIGGPLVDGRGQVVAITTAALAPVIPGTVVGLPYSSALRIAKALMEDGQVRRAYLGLDTVAITPGRADELHLSTAGGVLIRTVVAGSPAAFSNLRGPTGFTRIGGRLIPTGSDAITKINGTPVKEPEDLDAALATMKPGDKIALTVIRGTQGLTVHATLSER